MTGDSHTTLAIIGSLVFGALLFGTLGARHAAKKATAQEYMVGGRSFGALFLWLLLAGEIYTSFTFLGAAGLAYGEGAPALYILCYPTVAYIISYFLLPPVWRAAKRRNLLTGPDFLESHYQSKALGICVAIIGFLFLVPYVTLQMRGIEILLDIAGYASFNSSVAVIIAFVLIAIFVYVAGLRGIAWAAIIKDSMVLLGVVFAGIVIPIHFFGSPAHLIHKLLEVHPGWLSLKTGTGEHGTVWFVTTVILTSLGFYMWPDSMAAIYSAKSEDTLRRNAMYLPAYQLMLLLIYFAGFTALLVLPGLTGPAADQSFMLVVQKYYPPWVLGLLAGAGALAGLIPASAQVLGAASIFTKNILGDWLGIVKSDHARTHATRVMVLVVSGLALLYWLRVPSTMVGLNLIAYEGVTQFFPGVVFALVWRRASAAGVMAGILSGLAFLIVLFGTHHESILGINAGFFALTINVVVCVAICLFNKTLRPLETAD